ncbi:1,4-alpha-glucan branching protein GlgB [Ideonella sp. DXS29W]|uniref:1,4-alpha-glucan branching enzyme GlgB n=1 Tax=Ideonella lacteola TaxID=2984193 RepID=A0ABU9BNR6_9BURK
MLGDSHVQALLAARHPDPFSVLGLHPEEDGQMWLRVVWPSVAAIDVLDAKTGKKLVGLNHRDPDGFFEAPIPRRKQRFAYRLKLYDPQGLVFGEVADAYAFGPQLPEAELLALKAGRHPRPYTVLGAHAVVQQGVPGVRFAVWAPTAKRVSVVGDFNQWDGRRHPMRYRHEAGVWEIFVPHVIEGDLYKFEVLSRDGRLLPLKADPYARAAQLRPDNASKVAPMPPVRKLPQGRADANRRDAPISIYEVHAPSWRRLGSGPFPSWDDLAEALPAYVADMGFTHVELLPITEHPYDGSWGYQTLGQYAASARFGSPDGLARFVDACHARGLGVLLDWVPAHFPSDGHGLAQFDGTALYEYGDPREGVHRDWNTLIPNFGRYEVREFLVGSALFWTERYAVDGLRVDAVASMLYRDYSRPSGEWVPNVHGGRENLEAIALLQQVNRVLGTEAPGSVTIAEESTAFPKVSAPTDVGGLGFHYKWNMGWMNDTLAYMREDPVHRRWHHDKMTFGLVYAFNENFVLPISHDEVVHGKGSMIAKMPGDDWQRFANLRAYYGFMWGHPGKKLLFMGQEFAQPDEWHHDAHLPWRRLDDPRHAGVQALVRDLNRVYRTQPALHRLDCEAEGFEWIARDEADTSVLAWVRRDGQGHAVIVACNFTPVPREGYRLGVPPGASAWREVLNTDSSHYGGSNVGNRDAALPVENLPAHGRDLSIVMTLPPLATVYLVAV